MLTVKQFLSLSRRVARNLLQPMHCIIFCIVISPFGVAASNGEIRFILSGSGGYYTRVAQQMSDTLAARYPDMSVNVYYLTDKGWAEGDHPQLLITLGTEACGVVLSSRLEASQLCLLVTRRAWYELDASRAKEKAAIFVDQPVARYIALARELVPGANTVSTLLGPVSSEQLGELQAASERLGLNFIYDTVSIRDNPLVKLSPLLERSQVFVAVPDRGIFNRNIAQWALHLGFKTKTPVIGFSRSYGEAGAAASLYTAPEDVIRQATQWVDKFLVSREEILWLGLDPLYFTVRINGFVSRGLRLPIVEEEELHRRVSQSLRESGDK